MSLLSPRLQLKVAQKQILTPGLVQMVTVLQLNRLELKEMITQEIVKNPVLEEASEEPGEEITPEELAPLLEADGITKEMIAAQESKLQLLQQMLETTDNDAQQALIRQHDADIDVAFFQLFSAAS